MATWTVHLNKGNGFSFAAVENDLVGLEQELNLSSQQSIDVNCDFKDRILEALKVRNFQTSLAMHEFLLLQGIAKKGSKEEQAPNSEEHDRILATPRVILLYPQPAAVTPETLPFHVKWLLHRPLDFDFQLNACFVDLIRRVASLLDPLEQEVQPSSLELRTELPQIAGRIKWLVDHEAALRRYWAELRAECGKCEKKLARLYQLGLEEKIVQVGQVELEDEEAQSLLGARGLRIAAEEMPRSSRLRTFILNDLFEALPDLLLQQSTFSLIRLQFLDGLQEMESNKKLTAAALRALADLYQCGSMKKTIGVVNKTLETGGWKFLGDPLDPPNLVLGKDSLIPMAQKYVCSLDWYQEELVPGFSKTWERMDILFEIAKRARSDKTSKEQANCMTRILIQEELAIREKVLSGPFHGALKDLAEEVSRFRCLCAAAITHQVEWLGGQVVGTLGDYVKTWEKAFPGETLFPKVTELWKLGSVADLSLEYEEELGLDQIIENRRVRMRAECPSVVIEKVRAFQEK